MKRFPHLFFWPVVIVIAIVIAATPDAGVGPAIVWFGFAAAIGFVVNTLFVDAAPAPATTPPEPEHTAATPSGSPVVPWTGILHSLEVAGEGSRPPSTFRALFPGKNLDQPTSVEREAVAHLADDRFNPHDENAVAVWIDGQHVGFLSRTDALVYRPVIDRLTEDETHLQVPARVWCGNRGDGILARVTLSMPDADAVFPDNDLPDSAHVVLPVGSTIQVTKENEHMDVLAPLTVSGRDVQLAVTLHVIHEIRLRSAFKTVEVRVEGQAVGILSPTQAENMLPVVEYVAARQLTPVARATLRGNALKADVVLHVAKSQDIAHEWLEALGPARTAQRDTPTPARPEPEWDD